MPFVAEKYGHMTFSQAGQLARDAEVRRLWLCHFSQKLAVPEESLPAARRFFRVSPRPGPFFGFLAAVFSICFVSDME